MECENKLTECFPDGAPIDEWFYETDIPSRNLGNHYLITDYGIYDDGRIYTDEFQKLIDDIAENGGGVIDVPPGVYITGALFFKQGVHLFLDKGAMLKGSAQLCDYPILETRIEGETCQYVSALINADQTDGFTICGSGSIDGNGLNAWRSFWKRREWNPNCTNKDEQRPRLIYISNSDDVTIHGVSLQNSQYRTTHIYKCRRVKFVECNVYSPQKSIPAPSTDAFDIDVCSDVLIKNCTINVNDDAIALKGGKGPCADKLSENGSNECILIEDCIYKFCHGCITCGSEAVHNKNILMRRTTVFDAHNVLWLKMRPDTPQHYEYVTVEKVQGKSDSFVNITSRTQFYDAKGHDNIPPSVADHISVRDCNIKCRKYINMTADKDIARLSNFILEDLSLVTNDTDTDMSFISNAIVNNVKIIDDTKTD